MKQKITLTTLASLVILVTVFAGCSRNDDALPAEAAVARGGEPLNIRIAPKPGYTESSNTRSTVNDDTGAFAWEAGDPIYVYFTFDNDAFVGYAYHQWHYLPVNDTGFSYYIPGWKTVELDKGGQPVSKLVWPLGASSVTIRAFYFEKSDAPGYDLCRLDFDGTSDRMEFSKTFALGEEITVNLTHSTTRLVFTGLTANTTYRLKINGLEAIYPTWLDFADFTLCEFSRAALTSDAGGNLTVHAILDDKIDANGQVKLELVKDDGATPVYETTLTAQGTAGAYKMDGYIYKAKVATGGKVNPDNNPDLVTPAPIIPGNTVWELNGYYATAPDADVAKYYQWSADPAATVMDNDPCAGHGNWRMPSMKDFEKMAGWTEIWPWSQEATTTNKQVSNEDVWYAIFETGGYEYMSVDVSTDNSSFWCIGAVSPGPSEHDGSFYIANSKRWGSAAVRCVQQVK